MDGDSDRILDDTRNDTLDDTENARPGDTRNDTFDDTEDARPGDTRNDMLDDIEDGRPGDTRNDTLDDTEDARPGDTRNYTLDDTEDARPGETRNDMSDDTGSDSGNEAANGASDGSESDTQLDKGDDTPNGILSDLQEPLKQFKLDVIESHNQYRQTHRSPSLSPAEDLHKQAQDWANTIAEKGFLQYSETQEIGENVSFLECSDDDIDIGASVAKKWYAEQSKYDYDTPRWRKGVSNFTQMIWRATQEVGVGICRMVNATKLRYVIVTQYRPAGNNNMPGEFRKNVPPPDI